MRRYLVLTILMLIAGTTLRWQHLGASFNHFDEAFPTALIARARATGNLDMNPRDADVPGISKYNQYAGSSYHYAVLAWDTVMRVFPGWPKDNRIKPSIVRLRAFSALLGTAALLLLALAAWRTTGPAGAFVATTLMALNPTLIQDAHYARPDAMLTFLVIVFSMLVARTRPPPWRITVATGIVLGVLIAAKNTMGLLAALPLLWLMQRDSRRDAVRHCAAAYATAGIAFLLTEPGVVLHFRDFLDGVARLQTQYSHPFPIHGHPDGGATYDLASAYFTATLGTATFVLFLAGLWLWVRRREWPLLLVWIVPAIAFAAYFGAKTIFFERAYSAFLPGVFLACGVSASAFLARSRSTAALLSLTALAVAPGAVVTARFIAHDLSGMADRRVTAYDDTVRAAAAGIELVTTPLWHPVHLDELARRWDTTHQSFLAKIPDTDDEWTRRTYTELFRRLPARELHVLPGPFHDFPISTLQAYHVPTWRYVWIGEASPPAIPAPPSAKSAAAPFRWLSSHPSWYWGLANAAGLLTLLFAFQSLGRHQDGPSTTATSRPIPFVFPLAIITTVFLFRSPAFFHHPELNVDEAQTIAGAITLQFDPRYWHSVDGTTHGPLNDAVLLLPRLFGAPVSFVSARCVGAALIAGALIALWAAFRAWWGESVARLAVMPPLAFFALSTFWDFVHYTSEHLTLFLLALGAACIAHARRPLGWISAGISLGTVPWAKLQGIPVAAALVILGIALALRSARLPCAPDERPALTAARAISAFVTGLIVPSLVIAVYLAATGVWSDFWAAYVVNNLRYATETKMFTVAQMVTSMPTWTRGAEGFAPYVVGLSAFTLAALTAVALQPASPQRRRGLIALTIAVVILGLAIYCAVAPGRKFFHYLLFVILPLAGVAAAALAAAIAKGSAWKRGLMIALFCLSCIVPQVIAKARRTHPYLADAAADAPSAPVAAEILRHVRKGEPVGIWGYMPRYWVETGHPQAARDGHNERQVLPHPQQAYYRARYLADLQRTEPPVMVDAVGPGAFWLEDRKQYGHEMWPELAAWIAANYRLAADLDGARIYVRNGRERRQ